MDAKRFASLFESVKHMDEVVHGVREPSREFHIHAIAVTDIRKATGLSQAKFAVLIGVQVESKRSKRGQRHYSAVNSLGIDEIQVERTWLTEAVPCPRTLFI